MLGADADDYPPDIGPAAAATEPAAAGPGTRRKRTVVTDARAPWTCDVGASVIAEAMTDGPGALGTLHAVIYVCPEHQPAAEALITAADWNPRVEPAPPAHRWERAREAPAPS
jgi:hypothetical protein